MIVLIQFLFKRLPNIRTFIVSGCLAEFYLVLITDFI